MPRRVQCPDPAATDPDVEGGEFFAPRFINIGAPVRRPNLRRLHLSEAIADLWAVSERETGLAMKVSYATTENPPPGNRYHELPPPPKHLPAEAAIAGAVSADLDRFDFSTRAGAAPGGQRGRARTISVVHVR